MRILIGDVDPGEVEFFEQWRAAHPGVELDLIRGHLSLADLERPEHYDAVCVLGTPLTRQAIDVLAAHGARAISNRSIGNDNVDLVAARDAGVLVANVSYSPGSVAEFTLMLILASLRKLGDVRKRFDAQDFVPAGLEGRELANLTVGIVGAGRIGGRLAELLAGFGCTVLATDPKPRKELAGLVTYVTPAELYRRSDVVTVHALLDDSTEHLLDEAAFAAMTDGVVVVNCARGPIVDTRALIAALEAGKVGAAALDVLEGEVDYYFQDCRGQVIADPFFARLRAMPNVILTPHFAYLTREVVASMVADGLDHCLALVGSGPCDHEVHA